MKIKKILQPSCDHFYTKLELFSLSENWRSYDISSAENKLLIKAFNTIKSQHPFLYYHSLYHLLSCPFCVEKEYQILSERSHSKLWYLADKHPGEYLDLVRQAQTNENKDLRWYYFYLLYKNLAIKRGTVLFLWVHGNNISQQTCQRRAAGTTDNLPPNMAIPSQFIGGKNMSLHFEWDSITQELYMSLRGGSAKLRLAIVVHVSFFSGEQQTFSGKEIAVGGVWTIEANRAKNICRIDFIYNTED
ncbi:hypothetical protein [Candidatus Uabimicrobium sp. HlEnr_7]|uniref:hypothetical protein n=1 Tax=Candidatus Uabimicrobium helgolandensis TaxID=3095367 RepID=UPI003558C197